MIKNKENSTTISIRYVSDISTEKYKQIQREIDDLYQLLKVFCLQYNIPKEDHSLKKELNIKAKFLWVNLVNSNGKSLIGYGELDINIIKEI